MKFHLSLVVALATFVSACGLVGKPPSNLPPGDQCEVDYYHAAAGRYRCIFKERLRAKLQGTTPAFDACEWKFEQAQRATQEKHGVSCTTMWLGGAQRFVDNGDGTITDRLTGLMWEKKSDDDSVHDFKNMYTWSATGTAFDGTAKTDFVDILNDAAGGGASCFAGHCDWRLPSLGDLQTILWQPYECTKFVAAGGSTSTVSCMDPIFDANCSAGCTVLTCSCPSQPNTGSSTDVEFHPRTESSDTTIMSPDPNKIWSVSFNIGDANYDLKATGAHCYRAVRTAPVP